MEILEVTHLEAMEILELLPVDMEISVVMNLSADTSQPDMVVLQPDTEILVVMNLSDTEVDPLDMEILVAMEVHPPDTEISVVMNLSEDTNQADTEISLDMEALPADMKISDPTLLPATVVMEISEADTSQPDTEILEATSQQATQNTPGKEDKSLMEVMILAVLLLWAVMATLAMVMLHLYHLR